MTIQFKKATKQQSKLRLALLGPSGSGKTYSALAVGSELGKKIAVIDTERGSASKYADKFNFDVLNLETFHPETYIDAIKAAADAGYDVIVIDSLSHAWMGKEGALEFHDKEVARQKSKNTFTAWREVSKIHNALIDAMLQSPCDVVVTMRTKTAYVQDKDDKGYTQVRKVGMEAVQRDGMEYEFDVVLDLDLDHNGVVSKTRCDVLDKKVFPKPGKDLAGILKTWLTDGTPAPAKPEPKPKAESKPEPKATTSDNISEKAYFEQSLLEVWIKMGKPAEDFLDYRNDKLAGKSIDELREILEKWENARLERHNNRPPIEILESIESLTDQLTVSGIKHQDIANITNAMTGGKSMATSALDVLLKIEDRLKGLLEKESTKKEAA